MGLKHMVLLGFFLLVVVLEAEGQLLGMTIIRGSLFCSANGNMVANATTPTPPFSNALVQVSCGGTTISSATTNASGAFTFVLNPLQMLLTTLLSPTCNLVVASPLSTCNSSLPALGILQSPLQLVGIIAQGLLSIINVAPSGFRLVGI